MVSRFPRWFTLLFSVLFIFTIGLSGCGSSQSSLQKSPSEQTPVENIDPGSTDSENEPASTSIEVTLYFPTTDAEGLVPVKRTINVTNSDANTEPKKGVSDQKIIEAIFDELNNPPENLENPLPEGTKLIDSSVNDSVAVVNLSKEFKDNFIGGATGEQMTLYSIVNSLTSLPNIEQVEFHLEGELKVAILGELDTTTPISRNEGLVIEK